MLQLYFYPMACSLSSRIALMEAGIEARYSLAHIWKKKVLEDDSDFLDGVVEGRRAGAGAGEWRAADRSRRGAAIYRRPPARKRAGAAARRSRPLSPAGMAEFRRHRNPQGVPVSDLLVQGRRIEGERARTHRAERIGGGCASCEPRLLVGDRFTVADAHLAWSLLLLGRTGVDLAQWPPLVAYRDRIQARPQVKAAIGIEMQLLKTMKA